MFSKNFVGRVRLPVGEEAERKIRLKAAAGLDHPSNLVGKSPRGMKLCSDWRISSGNE